MTRIGPFETGMTVMTQRMVGHEKSKAFPDPRSHLGGALERIQAGVPKSAGWSSYLFNSLTLSSHFQPVMCVAQQRIVGYEGLLLAHNLSGQHLRPDTVFTIAADYSEQI